MKSRVSTRVQIPSASVERNTVLPTTALTASGLQKTLHAAMGAAIISLLSAVATLVFEVVKGIAQ